jgi:ABC-type bacteriocin/lantibiotic exporter with double-glycine peptidase domain
VCITTGSLLALSPPLILKWLIDQAIPQKHFLPLMFAVVLVFLAHEGRTALNSFGSYIMLGAAQNLALKLRMNLLRHLDTLSADYFEQTSTGAVIYPLKEPIEEISYFGSDILPAVVRLVLTTGLTITAMIALSPLLTVAIVPLMMTFIVTTQHYRAKLAVDADVMQGDRLRWSSFLQEHLSAIVPIQLLGQEKPQERRAFRLLARTVRSQQKLNRTAIWFSTLSSIAVAVALCTVIGYGSTSVMSGRLSLGGLVAFYGFIAQLFDPLMGAADLYARTQKVFANIRQVQLVLSVKTRVEQDRIPVSLSPHSTGKLQVRRVEFGYSSNKDLLNIDSLEISPGEHLALSGENGAGKSSLAKLLARVYDPISGSIHLDGIDLRRFDLRELRKNICYVPREPMLFEGTILSNLRFVCPEKGERQLLEAIEVSGLAAVISSLPLGIQQRVGPAGCQLSGGERQRVAIARALLQEPRILILDEAISCLDASAETMVIHNLKCSQHLDTLIVISHRPSTLEMFNRILVLAHGRIVFERIGSNNSSLVSA